VTLTPVVVLGDLMTDVATRLARPVAVGSDTPASIRLHGGGAGANTAAWLAALGQPVSFIGRVGDDAPGAAASAELRAAGVRTLLSVDPQAPTGTCVVLVDAAGERSMLPDPGANATLAPEHLPRRVFEPGGHFHLSGYALLTEGSRAAALAALELARSAGMSVSIDPASVAPLRAVGAERALGWFRAADVLLPNDEELKLLANIRTDQPGTPRSAAQLRQSRLPVARALARRLDTLVVATLGAAGAVAAGPGGQGGADTDPAPTSLVDTTGCGDAFAAGFLHVWLGAPSSLEAALARGVEQAARCATQVGARPR